MKELFLCACQGSQDAVCLTCAESSLQSIANSELTIDVCGLSDYKYY